MDDVRVVEADDLPTDYIAYLPIVVHDGSKAPRRFLVGLEPMHLMRSKFKILELSGDAKIDRAGELVVHQ